MRQIKFHSPETVLIENGCSKSIGEYSKKLGVTKALIITDETLQKVGLVDKIIFNLESAGIGAVVYNQTQPEPPLENVEESLELYAQHDCDGVIGLGGGSPIDVAKAVAMLVTNKGEYADYIGIDNVPTKCAPLIVLPTTAGTGSEVSQFSIIILDGSKAGVVDANILPDIALVDPELTYSVPKRMTAATGLDALCHHLESYLSTNATVLSDAICLEGIETVSTYLRKAVGDGQNAMARYKMSYASTLGGYVMNLTEGAAANHALAFALGAKFKVGHGLSNAVMLPYVFSRIGLAELEKVEKIGHAMGLALEGLNDRDILLVVTGALRQLVKDVDCLLPISELGVTEADIQGLVEETFTQTRVLNHSTYKLTEQEVMEIFKEAL